MIKNLPILFNIVWFQICWFACVLLGNKAALIVVGIVALAYFVIEKLRAELPLLLSIVVLGLIVDSTLIVTGVLNNNSALYLPPLWLSVLWLAFATTINHSLKPLLQKSSLFLLLASAGGPLCYKLGVQLTDIEFGYQQSLSLIIIACVWLLTGFIILKLYERWKDYAFG